MAENTGQEKTQDATPRRKQQARDRGQVASSRELNSMLMLLSGGVAAAVLGPYLVGNVVMIFQKYLHMERATIFDVSAMPTLLGEAVVDAFWGIAPFFLILTIAAIAGPLMMGGINFSGKAISLKLEKLDPIAGLQRIFAWRGLVELVKALAKFLVIGSVAIVFLYSQADQYIGLGQEPVMQAMGHASDLLVWGFIAISTTMILIALVDVPFQLWDHSQQLKMTFQEVKDDSKDTEGDPELRGRIKRMQREMAQRRMMAEIPTADVVITNPEHYSVALRYNSEKMSAPIVVAKGVDVMAMQIRKVANEYDIPILAAPPLARALHHTTEINGEIPAGLYLAVAKVLAYVFQLKQKPYWKRQKQHSMDDLPIPDDFKFDK